MDKTLQRKALLVLAKSRLLGDEENVSATAFLLAHQLGITSATINFNGSGDDGSYDDADLEGGEKPYIVDTGEGGTSSWLPNPAFGEHHQRLRELVQTIASDWVESTGTDWYNNEGGGGCVSVNFETGEVAGSTYVYEQVQHDVDSAEWNLLGNEEEEATAKGGA